jgi:hypothetical protein
MAIPAPFNTALHGNHAMTRRLASLLTVACVACGTPTGAEESNNTPPPGFQALFNGKDLAGWHGMQTMDPRAFERMPQDERARKIEEWNKDLARHWSVKDGTIENDGNGVYLTADDDLGDVEIYVDWKIGPTGDSGVYLRGTPQVQIWDYTNTAVAHLGADKGSGGLWNNTNGAPGRDPLVRADRPIGEWNTFHIVQVGARTTIDLNGKRVVDQAILENYWDKDRRTPIPARGPFQLQTHQHPTYWRNIYVRKIPAGEANRILAARDRSGFTAIFDGKSLEGWAGPVGQYEVVDGALRCKPRQGGCIYYNKEYADFVARVQFRLPPGGNNGLAIRYPGKGDAAYSGMCELQVLDNDADQYARLDPRQYHGSAYGMVPAARGYLRPVGEWNFQEVTVKGPKIKVELNGTVILDTDLSQVKEFMANSPHPGKDRTSGFLGFAGHGDPVEFRDVMVRPL